MYCTGTTRLLVLYCLLYGLHHISFSPRHHGSFSLYLFGEIAQNRCSQVLAVLTNKCCHGTSREDIALELLDSHLEPFLPLFNSPYGSASTLFYSEFAELLSEEGSQQGLAHPYYASIPRSIMQPSEHN